MSPVCLPELSPPKHVANVIVMLTVCVPAEADRDALDGLADVEVLVWNLTDPAPDGVGRTRFLLAPYMSARPSPDVLDAMPDLEVIQLLSAGVDVWRPIVPDGVTLANGRGVHGGSTAELAVAGILASLHHLPSCFAQQRDRRWQRVGGDDLDDRNVLVLGAGDIGRKVAAAVEVFGAHATLVARTARDDVRALADVSKLLGDHQIVVVALPLTDETRALVDAPFLAALPDGALVVNIARGPIVDTDALLAELTSGRLSAFLDVTDPEPLPEGHPLWSVPNVIITPHVGGGTSGWYRRGMRLVREQVERFAKGEPLENVVSGAY